MKPPDAVTESVPDAAAFQAAFPVSRETLAGLETYVGLLRDWNAKHNLVSAASLAAVWHRHVLDSAQLLPLIPASATTMADLGSGAGFPALVLAWLARGRLRVSLYESTAKKCRFLGEVAEKLGLTVDIHNGRIEDAPRRAFDVVTARACAPLDRLLGYAHRFQGAETVNLFLKGQNVEGELTAAYKIWRMILQKHQSLTDPAATVLEIRGLARV
jgi:16S rRNA (guanine527-N7)-methyltransferase